MRRFLQIVTVAAGLTGCTGRIAGPSQGGGSTPAGCTGLCLGVTSLPRIIGPEYQNSVLDVLGMSVSVASMPADGSIDGFFTNDQNPLGTNDVDSYRQTAEDVADALVTTPGVLAGLLAPLTPSCAQQGAACANAFIETYGSRLYRRPLTAAELSDYAALYTWAVTPATDLDFVTGGSGTFVDGIRYLTERLLQAPGFLYRFEIGTPTDDPNVRALTSQELAARLAGFLLRSVPDAQLSAAAAQGQLATPDQISRQVKRLMGGPQGDRVWKAFAHDFFLTDQIANSTVRGLPEAQASWSDAVAQDLALDVQQTFTHLVQTDGRLETLLTSPGGVVQGDSLQWIVGATGTPGSWAPSLPNRNGFLTWPGLLIATGHPGFTHSHFRGLWVRQSLLCQSIGAPDPALLALIGTAEANEQSAPSAPTDRDRMHNLSETNPVCANCHHYTNPIGYGLDSYDDLGRYRTSQIGVDGGTFPIDASGELAARPNGSLATDVDGPFANGAELIGKLAVSGTMAHCMERQVARFALQREMAADDEPALDAGYADFDAQGQDLRELAAALTTTDAFRYRRLVSP